MGRNKIVEQAAELMEESRSYLRETAPFEIELAFVRFNDNVTVCGRGSDKFTVEDRARHGLRFFYCGAIVIFERDGWPSDAVSATLVLGMQSLKDHAKVDEGVKEKAAKKHQDAAMEKQAAEMEKKAAAEKYIKEKAAAIKRKPGRPRKDAPTVEHAELEADELNIPPPAPKPIKVKDVAKDLAASGEAMSPEEMRSLQAASKRAAARRK